jgi:uncharacterized protein (TIGR00251 family)
MKKPFYQEKEDYYLNLYVQPNAKQTKIIGLHDGYLKIQIMAPAIENKANLYLKKWLSKEFACPISRIDIIQGEQSRYKKLCLHAPKLIPSWVHTL